ncbi:hypothetical protein KP509_13G063100 [Ceratopteris richardii]|nr:hypothetical protein KP509_13G063100 [Ceratopteris richardii]
MLFQLKVLLKSGLGEETYGAPFLFKDDKRPTIAGSIEEMELMLFGAMDQLLAKTDLRPSDIDVLIVNVSMFYPNPSLSAHLVHRYRMRDDIRTFNISGMGCAAGMIAVDLASRILRVHRNQIVVVVGSENLTFGWYAGQDKSMLVPNCLFRNGSYALLLSNRRQDRARSKFELVQSVRVTTGASDASYNVIFTREDDEGNVGTSLSVKLLDVASKAITLNLQQLVPYNMPFSELTKVGLNYISRRFLKKELKAYTPDFRKAFDHFCLHPGGKAVVDGVGRSLRLSDYDMEPARMTLHRFGNTSSSGLWYGMAYCEAKGRLRKGNKVWQLALGSGFKCNSAVWKVLRDVKPDAVFNPWMDCIHRYPVEIMDRITPSHRYYNTIKEAEALIRLEEEAEEQRLVKA